MLADRPDSADQYEFCVEDGDVIMVATDGIFDNVPDRLLVAEMDKVRRPNCSNLSLLQVQHCKDELVLQQCANSIALMARRLSRDSKVRYGLGSDYLRCCIHRLLIGEYWNCSSNFNSSRPL